MKMGKEQIVGFLKDKGDSKKAQEADKELPEKVDTEKDAGLLKKFGVDPEAIKRSLGRKIPGL